MSIRLSKDGDEERKRDRQTKKKRKSRKQHGKKPCPDRNRKPKENCKRGIKGLK